MLESPTHIPQNLTKRIESHYRIGKLESDLKWGISQRELKVTLTPLEGEISIFFLNLTKRIESKPTLGEYGVRAYSRISQRELKGEGI